MDTNKSSLKNNLIKLVLFFSASLLSILLIMMAVNMFNLSTSGDAGGVENKNVSYNDNVENNEDTEKQHLEYSGDKEKQEESEDINDIWEDRLGNEDGSIEEQFDDWKEQARERKDNAFNPSLEEEHYAQGGQNKSFMPDAGGFNDDFFNDIPNIDISGKKHGTGGSLGGGGSTGNSIVTNEEKKEHIPVFEVLGEPNYPFLKVMVMENYHKNRWLVDTKEEPELKLMIGVEVEERFTENSVKIKPIKPSSGNLPVLSGNFELKYHHALLKYENTSIYVAENPVESFYEDNKADETDETDNDDEADETDETDETDEDNEADETGDDDETDETDLPKWTVYKGEFEITRIGTTRIIARTIDNAGNISEEAIKDVKIDKKPTPKPTTPPKDNDRPPSGGGGGGGKTDPDDDDTVKKPDTTVPGATTGSPVDLAVFLHTDKSIYGEGEIITFTIEYKNKSSNTAYGVAIEAEIPNNTTLDKASEGEVDKNKITWKIDTLSGKDSGKIEYTVKVNELDKAEIKATNTATISFTNSALNPDDDSSTISFLLYSDRFKDNFHSKYIYGYEDNTFRPGNNITRAEVAAIMFNILDLKEDNTVAKDYPDLADSHWAYKQIQAVTGANIFTGYEDGSFRPNNYITRAEFATVLANHLGLKNVESLKVNFADIQGHWAKNFIEEIYRVKLIQGYIENDVRVFKPDNHITRAEAVTIINNMLFRGPLLGASAPFDDVAENHWAHGHILESSIDHYYTRNDDETESIVKEEE
jgi:uncharacterized repeat protein (TIGR01451 family)